MNRKKLNSLVIAALASVAVFTTSASVSGAVRAILAGAEGGGQMTTELGVRVMFEFEALQGSGNSASGTATFRNRDTRNRIELEIVAMSIVGNRAYFLGVDTPSNTYAVWGAEDNGEGANAPSPDRITPLHFEVVNPADPSVQLGLDTMLRPIDRGNVEVPN